MFLCKWRARKQMSLHRDNTVVLYCIVYLSLHCHHQNDSCNKVGSDESHFNVSLIVRDEVTRQCLQTTTFWRERRAEADSNRGPSAYQPTALPLGQTGWQPTGKPGHNTKLWRLAALLLTLTAARWPLDRSDVMGKINVRNGRNLLCNLPSHVQSTRGARTHKSA